MIARARAFLKKLSWRSLLSAGFAILALLNLALLSAFSHTLTQLQLTFQLDTATLRLIAGNIYVYLGCSLTISVGFAVFSAALEFNSGSSASRPPSRGN
ncbi:MAG: hypothetical protein KF799_15980 [Bdellovibrionales bacterium]|nr:hypothetical protein [Bdellovibrionales bacterium]